MRFPTRSLSSFSLLAIALCQLAWARPLANGRGITAEDYFAFEFLSDPQLSPDGKLAAYVVTTVDQKQNRRYSAIWMARYRRQPCSLAVHHKSAVLDVAAVVSRRWADSASLIQTSNVRCCS